MKTRVRPSRLRERPSFPRRPTGSIPHRAAFDRFLFEAGSLSGLLFTWFFFIAIAFGLLRLAFTLACACVQWRRMR